MWNSVQLRFLLLFSLVKKKERKSCTLVFGLKPIKVAHTKEVKKNVRNGLEKSFKP